MTWSKPDKRKNTANKARPVKPNSRAFFSAPLTPREDKVIDKYRAERRRVVTAK